LFEVPLLAPFPSPNFGVFLSSVSVDFRRGYEELFFFDLVTASPPPKYACFQVFSCTLCTFLFFLTILFAILLHDKLPPPLFSTKKTKQKTPIFFTPGGVNVVKLRFANYPPTSLSFFSLLRGGLLLTSPTALWLVLL